MYSRSWILRDTGLFSFSQWSWSCPHVYFIFAPYLHWYFSLHCINSWQDWFIPLCHLPCSCVNRFCGFKEDDDCLKHTVLVVCRRPRLVDYFLRITGVGWVAVAWTSGHCTERSLVQWAGGCPWARHIYIYIYIWNVTASVHLTFGNSL